MLTCPHSPSLGTMGSGLRCWSIFDSTAHSWHSEYCSRRSLQAGRNQKRVDHGQEDLPIHLSQVLQTRVGSVGVPLKPPGTQVCFDVLGSRSACCGRFSQGLEKVDLCNPSLVVLLLRILKKIRADEHPFLLLLFLPFHPAAQHPL